MRRPTPLEQALLLVDLGLAVRLLATADTAYLRGYLQGRLDADLATLRRQLEEVQSQATSGRRWRR